MKRTVFIVAGIVVALALLIAFGGLGYINRVTSYRLSLALPAPTQMPAYYPAIGGGAPQESFASPAPSTGFDVAQSPGLENVVSNNLPSSGGDRLVIQNADLSIVVTDVNARVRAIQDMARQMGGFVVSVNVYQSYAADGAKVPQAQVVIRVPAEKLNDALDQIKKDTVDVPNETATSQDVTAQYVDLQSRLTAKQAAEAQLLKIMQNAEKTEDVLNVYAQLQQVQSDIEVLKGQIKYYEESAAFSAVSVNIIAEETVQPIEVGPWKPQGVARDAIQRLIDFWKGFAEGTITFFLFTLPALITVAIPLFIVYLLGRWVYRKVRKPVVEETPKEKAKK